jgi:hypothetical protein
VHEQMAERQKKDPLQKALIFSKRAIQIVAEDIVPKVSINEISMSQFMFQFII